MSQEDIQRNKRIVDEILEQTGHKLSTKGPANTPEAEAERRLLLANQEVMLVVKKYNEDHPIATIPEDLRKEIMQVYLFEFSRWSKDDCIYMLCLMQTMNAMKKFGYK